MQDKDGARPTWHFWTIGGLSLLWNAFGAIDYSLTRTRNEAYLAQFPPEVIAVIDGFPGWVSLAWALGVWGAIAGSVLLLLRSRLAVHAFGISLLGLAGSTVYQLGLDLPPVMTEAGMVFMNALIWAGALFLLWYALSQRRAGLLR